MILTEVFDLLFFRVEYTCPFQHQFPSLQYDLDTRNHIDPREYPECVETPAIDTLMKRLKIVIYYQLKSTIVVLYLYFIAHSG